ncbi:DDRGK domain-containing protein [Dunaliella salina]|uniref:DDRGK domain-containing protein n=1 Tax=Dunaliella salina TaxID=3046 RepID=A0ABQ7GPV1_DUNSA|nr:DDRGK domain-containing protein [Dunaliella salina]|eukprot:KAF5836645.1 DDRGK domain-containing protein [Dunaliella salina]
MILGTRCAQTGDRRTKKHRAREARRKAREAERVALKAHKHTSRKQTHKQKHKHERRPGIATPKSTVSGKRSARRAGDHRTKKHRAREARREAREAERAAREARGQRVNLYEERRRQRDEAREAQEAAQEEAIAQEAAARAAREDEEASKWMSLISVDQEGTDVIDRIHGLEAMGRLTGVMDERGKYIYITLGEMHAVARHLIKKGRVTISELAAQSSSLIDLEPRTVGTEGAGKRPMLDFDALAAEDGS